MIPSVTQVLGCFSDFSWIRPEVLEHAADRGTRVHRAIASHLLGLWSPPLDKEAQPYFDSFRRWADIMVVDVLFVEQELVCDCFGYKGHIDAGLTLNGEQGAATIIDWKTPVTEARTWKGQVAAYWHLAEKHADTPLTINRCASIMLSPVGRPAKMREYTANISPYFNAFIGALQAYKFFK